METRRKPGRIAGVEWTEQRAAEATAVYNANYTYDMRRTQNHEKPWSVMGPGGFRTFATHAEALEWAFDQPIAPDLGARDQESVTTGWAPKPSREDAWNEKWELTR